MSGHCGSGSIARALVGVGIAAGLAAPGPAAAKERLVRHLGVEDGLRPEHVAEIAQDEEGFLWLGTGGGLVRYDGERFVPWAPAAIRGRIDRIAIHRGVVIAAGWEGPVLRTTTASPEAIELRGPDGASLIGARHVAFDRAGRLWLVRRDGRLLRSSDLGATWSVPLARSPAGAGARAVREATAPGGGLYVLTADALWAVDASDRAVLASRLLIEHPGEGGVDVLPMPDGSLLTTLSSGGVQRHRPGALGSVVWRGTEHGRAGRMARRGDVAWVAFTDALMAVRPGREPEVLPMRQAPAYGGRAIFVDREGSLWVGNARGAFQLPEPETVAWNIHDGLPSRGVVSLARTEEGIWVLLWAFMLARIDPEPPRPTWLEELAGLAAPRPPPPPRARRIAGTALAMACPDERGVLWGRAVAPGQPSRLVTRRPREPFELRPEAPGSADCAPARGGGVWIANEQALWITDGDELRALAPLPPLAEPEVPRLTEGASGTLWHATPGRLCRASGAALRAGRGAWTCAPMAVQSVTGLAEMPSGAVWIASNWNRVTRWSPEGSGPLPGAAALPSNVTDVIEPAADGGVWIGGLGYLLRVEERPDRPEGWAVLEALGPANGMPAFGAVDVHEDPDGTLWVTNAAGVLEVPRTARRRPPPILTPTLIEATFDGRRRDGDREIHLAAGANTVSLQLSALSYRDPSAIRFRVRVREGGSWSAPAREPNLQLVDLPAGAYRVEIAASADEQTWTAGPAALAFVVDRPWYLRAWAWALGALAAAGALLAIHRLRVAIAVRLERQRLAIAMDLHDEVGSGLGGIGLMAGLSAEGALDEEARRAAAAKIAHTARSLGESLAGIVASLREEPGTLRALAADLVERATSLFPDESPRLVVDYPASWPALELGRDVVRNVRLIVAEALHNAAKHARATRVVLGAAATRDELSFWVQDDGRGTPAQAHRAGLGLTSMRRRARRIGAALAVESPPPAHDRGTKVVVTVAARAQRRPEARS